MFPTSRKEFPMSGTTHESLKTVKTGNKTRFLDDFAGKRPQPAAAVSHGRPAI